MPENGSKVTESWRTTLAFDPVPALLAWPDEALRTFVRRDLLGEDVPPAETLWELPGAVRQVQRQRDNGSWRYAGKADTPRQNYSLLETFRTLGILVERYGFTRDHPAIAHAAEYVFSCQTADGDIRGILGNQTIPYYHGALLALLSTAGYAKDERLQRGLDWLLTVRQDDGGWIVPAQAVPPKQRTDAFWTGPPVTPDPTLPHAHLATGMALRAFAAQPDPGWRARPEVQAAGKALKRRFFQADKYNDRRHKSYWFKFQFPFWWSNLLTALDTLSYLGFSRDDTDIAAALAWFREEQEEDSLWPTGYGSGRKARENQIWVGLAVCRMLGAYFGS
jgi:hypothetical protein